VRADVVLVGVRHGARHHGRLQRSGGVARPGLGLRVAAAAALPADGQPAAEARVVADAVGELGDRAGGDDNLAALLRQCEAPVGAAAAAACFAGAVADGEVERADRRLPEVPLNQIQRGLHVRCGCSCGEWCCCSCCSAHESQGDRAGEELRHCVRLRGDPSSGADCPRVSPQKRAALTQPASCTFMYLYKIRLYLCNLLSV
jgi:hypothetical protein